jgi:hypothetical protein
VHLQEALTPLNVCHFQYFQGANASKIIGKTKKSDFCVSLLCANMVKFLYAYNLEMHYPVVLYIWSDVSFAKACVGKPASVGLKNILRIFNLPFSNVPKRV